MAASAQDLLDWIIANWPSRPSYSVGTGTPESNNLAPPVANQFYVDSNNGDVYIWGKGSGAGTGAWVKVGESAQSDMNESNSESPSHILNKETYLAAQGYVRTNVGGVFPSNVMPAVAITEVHSVATIELRDALQTDNTVGLGKGDMAIVTDASADSTVGSGGATYVWSGSSWLKIKVPTDVVTSVNGNTGDIQVEKPDVTFNAAIPVNGDVIITLNNKKAFDIVGITHKLGAGTCKIRPKVNGVLKDADLNVTTTKSTKSYAPVFTRVGVGESFSINVNSVDANASFLTVTIDGYYPTS